VSASPIDSFDGAEVVYTYGPGSFGTILFLVIALLIFVGFIARVILHENHAYAAMEAHMTPEAGPAVEGEPEVASV
jgi:hypothetical protein